MTGSFVGSSRLGMAGLERSCRSSGFEQRYPVVRAGAADRLGEGDVALDLAARDGAGQLPHALDDLGEARGRQRMTARLEAARGVDREPSVQRGLAVERRRARLA